MIFEQIPESQFFKKIQKIATLILIPNPNPLGFIIKSTNPSEPKIIQ